MMFQFDEPLIEGVIEKRKSQFTMMVSVDHKTGVSCHCPTTGRMQRHITELANSLQEHERAILLTCFLYDNPGFQIIERSTNYEEVRATVDRSLARGVETWQANFRITPEGVILMKYFPIDIK